METNFYLANEALTPPRKIPKTIHYCWFGGNPKSELIQRCIESWEKYCPDYEIIEWNESNFDINCCQYVKDAYAAKKWAFVSDYARLWVVYTHGGIYLDTDVELKQNLDELLTYDAWFAHDDMLYIATGLGFGSIKDFPVLKNIMDYREQQGFNGMTNMVLETPIFMSYFSMKLTADSQTFNNVRIVGVNDYARFGRHHAELSWMPLEDKHRIKKCIHRYWKMANFLRNSPIREKLGNGKLYRIYMFIAYDLCSNGPMYFIKRWTKRLFGRK